MKIDSIVPNISNEFQTLLELFYANNVDIEIGLNLVNQFLIDYPIYPEALVFKSTLLIDKGRYKEALLALEMVEKIDRLNTHYMYNMAEVYYKLGKKEKALKILNEVITRQIFTVTSSLSSFLMAIEDDYDKVEIVNEKFLKKIINYIENDEDDIIIDKNIFFQIFEK